MYQLKTVSILGCGWFGLPLGKHLSEKGFIVKGSTTQQEKLTELSKNNIEPFLIVLSPDREPSETTFFDCDILIVNIPPRLRHQKAEVFTGMLRMLIKAVQGKTIKQLLFISSTSVYGDLNSEVNELSEIIPDTPSGKVLAEAEGLLNRASGFSTSILRFAGLIGPGRNPGSFFLRKTGVPNGLAPVNLVHLKDCIGITTLMIEQQLFPKMINVCAPHHPTRKEFYTHAAVAAGNEPPHFIEEPGHWKIVSSCIVPSVIPYTYNISNLLECNHY